MIAHVGATNASEKPPARSCSPIKYQRLLRGWSQQDVVDALYQLCSAHGRGDVGLNIDTIRRWETGRHKPSPVYRKHLCTLFGKNAAELGFLDDLEVMPAHA